MMDELTINGVKFLSQDKIIDECLRVVLTYYAYKEDPIPTRSEVESMDYYSDIIEVLFGIPAKDEFRQIYARKRFIEKDW